MLFRSTTTSPFQLFSVVNLSRTHLTLSSYEDDAKLEPVKTGITSAPPVVNGSTSIKTEAAVKSEPGAADQDNTKAEEEEDDDDDIDINLGGNSDRPAPAQQNHHEDHGYSRGPPGGHKDDG